MCKVNKLEKRSAVLFASCSIIWISVVKVNDMIRQMITFYFELPYKNSINLLSGRFLPSSDMVATLIVRQCNSLRKQSIHILQILNLVSSDSKRDVLLEKDLSHVNFQK